ncbi:type II toxin-antitoxin system VapC family toxin [Moraxella boevrei]|uniref:type II toxin-antitoxin system VapC family toxin n=1 Tax=Faucicola boevrei TaxID=346665 RepID=UPI0037368E3C
MIAQIKKYHLYEILPINEYHILNLQNLEYFHKDPFDRIIISQAMCEDLTLLTVDEHIVKYPIKFINNEGIKMANDEKYQYLSQIATEYLGKENELTSDKREIALIALTEIQINSGGFLSFFEHSTTKLAKKFIKFIKRLVQFNAQIYCKNFNPF